MDAGLFKRLNGRRLKATHRFYHVVWKYLIVNNANHSVITSVEVPTSMERDGLMEEAVLYQLSLTSIECFRYIAS